MAIEALKSCNNGTDLELCGIQDLANYHEGLKSAIQTGELDDSFTFREIFGLDTNFFYTIEQIDNGKICNYERGIACVHKHGDKFFLKRKLCFVSGENISKAKPVINCAPSDIRCCPVGFNTIIYSCTPPTYLECLAPEHSIITSTESCFPQSLHFNKNSLLLRFDDQIENVEFNDNRFIDKIIKVISQFAKQIKLKTSKLSLKRVESEVVDFVPTSNIKAKRGSLYYDESDDALKLYDGSQWKTLAFKKD